MEWRSSRSRVRKNNKGTISDIFLLHQGRVFLSRLKGGHEHETTVVLSVQNTIITSSGCLFHPAIMTHAMTDVESAHSKDVVVIYIIGVV